MAKTKNAKSALPHVQRLLEDEYVQEQIRNAATGLRNAYGRAARKRAQATEDKKLYGSLRHAATSIRNATIALQRPRAASQAPRPEHPHHRARDRRDGDDHQTRSKAESRPLIQRCPVAPR
jgi:hypothetical protein